jgi:thiol-disulfide isomerase/thioredoxin
MRHWGLAAVGSLLVAVVWVGADEPKKDEAKKGGALKEAKAEYDAWLKEKQAEIAKAPPAFQQELQSELRESIIIKTDTLFEVAEQEADSEDAFEIFAPMLTKALDPDKAKKARLLVIKHHLDKPYIKKVLVGLAQNADEGSEALLGRVAEKNADPECQAIATLTLGMIAQAKAKQTNGQEKDDLIKMAEKHFTKAKDKFADVKYQGTTVGKIAEGRLSALKVAGNLAVGKKVPDISGEDLNGGRFKLSEAGKGKVVMLSFWATWCPPCMRLVPHEAALVEKMKDKPFELIGINGDPELTDDVRKIIEDKKIVWRSFKNQQKDSPPLSEVWEIGGWPTIYVIDHKGVIRHVQLGGGEPEKLDALIEDLVKEAEKDKK